MRLLSALCCILLFTQCQPHQSMEKATYHFHPLRLKPGEDLKKSIEQYVKDHGIQAGWISTCVGSLTDLQVRFANQSAGMAMHGHFEIVSLTGTVGTGGSHLHISVSDSTGKTTGGHLLDSSFVYTTAEIVIGESLLHQFTREKDGSTPWPELQIKPRN